MDKLSRFEELSCKGMEHFLSDEETEEYKKLRKEIEDALKIVENLNSVIKDREEIDKHQVTNRAILEQCRWIRDWRCKK